MSLGAPSRVVRVRGVAHGRGRDGTRPSKISSDQATELRQGLAYVTVRVVLARRGVPGADELFRVEAMHVLDVTRDPDIGRGQGLVVRDVESEADLTGCPDCG